MSREGFFISFAVCSWTAQVHRYSSYITVSSWTALFYIINKACECPFNITQLQHEDLKVLLLFL